MTRLQSADSGCTSLGTPVFLTMPASSRAPCSNRCCALRGPLELSVPHLSALPSLAPMFTLLQAALSPALGHLSQCLKDPVNLCETLRRSPRTRRPGLPPKAPAAPGSGRASSRAPPPCYPAAHRLPIYSPGSPGVPLPRGPVLLVVLSHMSHRLS